LKLSPIKCYHLVKEGEDMKRMLIIISVFAISTIAAMEIPTTTMCIDWNSTMNIFIPKILTRVEQSKETGTAAEACESVPKSLISKCKKCTKQSISHTFYYNSSAGIIEWLKQI